MESEVSLPFKCTEPGCTRTFKSPQAVGAHLFISHQRQNPNRQREAKAVFKRSEDGSYLCPECNAPYKFPFLVGQHRYKVHGVAGIWALKTAQRLAARRRKKAGVEEAKPHTSTATAAPKNPAMDAAALYLYGRVEAQLETYAKDNGLHPKELFSRVGQMLDGAGQ